jgi:hypothetical protein
VRTGTRRRDGATASLAREPGDAADLAGAHETLRPAEPALRHATETVLEAQRLTAVPVGANDVATPATPNDPVDAQEPANTPAGRLPCHARILDDADADLSRAAG